MFIVYKNGSDYKVVGWQIDWENFLDPYIQAVGELKSNCVGFVSNIVKQQKHSPIEFVTGRVKPIESIREKMIRRNISEENLAQDMQDIAGLRIMVQFVDDVDEILEVLRQRQDMRVVQERDYIRHKKSSGYRSYHVVVEYPVDTIDGNETILAEIQIRTLSMNFGQPLNTRSIINIKETFQTRSKTLRDDSKPGLSLG